jgi:hypothetical protein
MIMENWFSAKVLSNLMGERIVFSTQVLEQLNIYMTKKLDFNQYNKN